jgi:hypothetical protein
MVAFDVVEKLTGVTDCLIQSVAFTFECGRQISVDLLECFVMVLVAKFMSVVRCWIFFKSEWKLVVAGTCGGKAVLFMLEC